MRLFDDCERTYEGRSDQGESFRSFLNRSAQPIAAQVRDRCNEWFKGGRPHALSKAQVRLAQAAMEQRDTKVSELCLELGVTKATIYRYVAPDGSLRDRGRQVLAR